MSNISKKIGEIDGIKTEINTIADVTEQSPTHFLVHTDNEISEIFLTPSGSLSDGNSIDGVEVSIESEKERIIRERFSNSSGGDNTRKPIKGMILKAPMPGMVKAISVSIGDRVQKNTQVLVLEAMKMENSITAGFIGLVSKIHIEVGTSVEKNGILIEFKSEYI